MSKKNLSKRIQELLSTATPKQKALLVCKERRDRNFAGKEPLLTEDEALALRDSLKTLEEKKEYNKWIDVYSVYAEFTPLFGIVYKEYQVVAERLLGHLREWEAYNQEENHLITLYEGIKELSSEEANNAYLTSLSYLTFADAKLKIAEDGYPEIDVEPLYNKIQEDAKSVYKFYSVAKAMVIVIEEYTKKTRSKDFRPDIVIESIERIKGDYAETEAPRYSRKLLKQREANGMKITPDEKKRAVYPSYEEIEPSEEELQLFKDKLNEIIAANK